MTSTTEYSLQLPSLVVGPADVVRLRRELENLSEYLHQAELRKPGKTAAKLPKTSRLLDSLAEQNHIQLLKSGERERLHRFLSDILENSPVVHISFAVDPSSAFTGKIVTWFRQNISPTVLVQLGLQPSIGAGCIVRTPNHSYDLSLRHRFTERRAALLEKLKENHVG